MMEILNFFDYLVEGSQLLIKCNGMTDDSVRDVTNCWISSNILSSSISSVPYFFPDIK